MYMCIAIVDKHMYIEYSGCFMCSMEPFSSLEAAFKYLDFRETWMQRRLLVLFPFHVYWQNNKPMIKMHSTIRSALPKVLNKLGRKIEVIVTC